MDKKISTKAGIAAMGIIFAVVFNFAAGDANAKSAKWRTVGKLGFSAGSVHDVSFAFNPVTKRPFVAFSDHKKSDKATVMQLVNKKWINVGSAAFSAKGISVISIAFDSAGNPYVAFEESIDSKIVIMKYNGSTWETLPHQGVTHGDGISITLAFNPTTNVPYVAFIWSDNGNEARVMKFNGTDDWDIIGATYGFDSYEERYTTLAFDANGNPYQACTEHVFSDKVTVLKYSGSASNISASWDLVGGEGISSGTGYFIALAINPSTSQPYVAYSDAANGNKLTVKKFNGTSWETLGSEGFTSRQADYVSLAFNPLTFEPYVTFQSGTGPSRRYEAQVIKYNGANWAYVGKSFGWGYYNEIAFAPNSGTPYVAYSDLSKKEKISVKKYSK